MVCYGSASTVPRALYIRNGLCYSSTPRVLILLIPIPPPLSPRVGSHSYTGFEHTSGRENDLKIAKVVQKQWEDLLHLPSSGGSADNNHRGRVFDAGSKDSRRMLLKEKGPRVWIDTYYVLLK